MKITVEIQRPRDDGSMMVMARLDSTAREALRTPGGTALVARVLKDVGNAVASTSEILVGIEEEREDE